MKPRTSAPLLTLAAISLRTQEHLVFCNTHWTFHRNEHWALVGPNNSGKTLLASGLTGAVPVVDGEIIYHLRAPAGRAPEDAVVHVSFEQQKIVAGDSPAAVRWFSLEEEASISVREFLSQDRVEEINPFQIVERSPQSATAFLRLRRRTIKLLQIEPLLDRHLPSLSNGEMRKVLLARALLRRPRLLILDDPFTGLDTNFREHLRQILETLMRQNIVHVLLIVNRPDELPRGITHLLCVNRCRVVAQGRRQEMLAHPLVQKLFHGHAPRIARRFPLPPRYPKADLVRLRHVSVRYNRSLILDDINWTIRPGESWALLGPNGAGKSTLLSLIIGDNPQAYANDVVVFGRRRGTGDDVWTLKKHIGWVSPELHLHFPETLTIWETVISGFDDSTGVYRQPTTRQRRRTKRWLRCLGLHRYAERSFGSLSAGLQRLTLLARALVKSPALLVLDEPCQGLDHAHRELVVKLVTALLRQNATTVIYVTHRPDEIPPGIHHVLRLKKGRAAADHITNK